MNGEMNLTRVIIDQIREIDARDESQILTELAGETVQEMFYTTEIYDRKAKRLVQKAKLSWAGSKEAARSRGNIVVDETPMITDLDDSVRVVVRITDLSKNFSIFGGCHQPRKMKVNDVDPQTKKVIGFHMEDDAYYFQKALSKAQRNGFQTILPADFIAKCLDRFVRLSSRPALKQAKEAEISQPPVPTKKELKAQVAWESITEEMVPDYNRLEKVFWDITKKQPTDMYAGLGVKNRLELVISPWEAFQKLKELSNGNEEAKTIL